MKIGKMAIVLSVFIYLGMSGLLNADFLIKCFLIVGSLLIHLFAHNIVEKVFNVEYTRFMDFSRPKRIENLSFCKKCICCFSGTIVNIIIMLICSNSESFYIRYLFFVNLSMVIFNFIPLKPADAGDLLEIVLECVFSERLNYKITKLITNISLVMMLFIGFFQLILFSNFSILTMALGMNKFNKLEIRQQLVLMNNHTEFI